MLREGRREGPPYDAGRGPVGGDANRGRRGGHGPHSMEITDFTDFTDGPGPMSGVKNLYANHTRHLVEEPSQASVHGHVPHGRQLA